MRLSTWDLRFVSALLPYYLGLFANSPSLLAQVQNDAGQPKPTVEQLPEFPEIAREVVAQDPFSKCADGLGKLLYLHTTLLDNAWNLDWDLSKFPPVDPVPCISFCCPHGKVPEKPDKPNRQIEKRQGPPLPCECCSTGYSSKPGVRWEKPPNEDHQKKLKEELCKLLNNAWQAICKGCSVKVTCDKPSVKQTETFPYVDDIKDVKGTATPLRIIGTGEDATIGVLYKGDLTAVYHCNTVHKLTVPISITITCEGKTQTCNFSVWRTYIDEGDKKEEKYTRVSWAPPLEGTPDEPEQHEVKKAEGKLKDHLCKLVCGKLRDSKKCK